MSVTRCLDLCCWRAWQWLRAPPNCLVGRTPGGPAPRAAAPVGLGETHPSPRSLCFQIFSANFIGIVGRAITTKYRDGLSTPPLGSDKLPVADVSHGVSAANGFAIPSVSVLPSSDVSVERSSSATVSSGGISPSSRSVPACDTARGAQPGHPLPPPRPSHFLVRHALPSPG